MKTSKLIIILLSAFVFSAIMALHIPKIYTGALCFILGRATSDLINWSNNG